jgi:hypothetical protein
MDKMREEFDRAFGVVFEKIEMTADVAEKTRNTMLQLYSAGWHDSRAALVVNTSELHSGGYHVTGCVYLSDVEDMLDKAGILYE